MHRHESATFVLFYNQSWGLNDFDAFLFRSDDNTLLARPLQLADWRMFGDSSQAQLVPRQRFDDGGYLVRRPR